MIYVSDKKATVCKGDFHPAELYKGNRKITGYVKASFEREGSITLKGCYNDKLHNAQIFGNSVQDGEPSPDNPIEIKSVGELVTEGEHSGKYKIRVTAYGDYKEPQSFDVFLDEPLRKAGVHEDYIDFENKKAIRNTNIKVFDGAEAWAIDSYRLYTKCGNLKNIDAKSLRLINTHFPSHIWEDIAGNIRRAEGEKIIGAAIQGGSYFCVTPAQKLPTVEEWKSRLSAWNNAGTPLTVIYGDSEREEDISLPALPTFRGTTIYEIETETTAKICGEYKKMEV